MAPSKDLRTPGRNAVGRWNEAFSTLDCSGLAVRVTASFPVLGGTGAPAANERVGELEQELLAAREERQALVAQIRQLREQNQELKREQRASEQRAEAQARREAGDPLASERTFLQAVRVAYARMFDEDDRVERPLRDGRSGRVLQSAN